MKSILSLFSLGLLIFCLAACGGKSSEENDNPMTLEKEDTITTIQKDDYHTMTIEIDESTERLDQEITDIETELDSL